MNRTRRYSRSGAASRDGDVDVFGALDPVTGLPVRIYRFAGEPRLAPGQVEHPCLPRLLESGLDDEGGFVVTELLSGVRDLATQPGGLDDATAAAAFDALAHAHAQGVAHGDLQARRVLRRGDDVWLEGVGVPWRDGATAADDVRALAGALLALPGHALSGAGAAALRAALEDDDAGSAAIARALDQAAHAPSSRSPVGAQRPSDDPSEAPAPPHDAAPAPLPDAPPHVAADTHADTPADTPAIPAAPQTTPAAPTAPTAATPVRFSKTPPPGVEYRSGDTPLGDARAAPARPSASQSTQRQRRRLWLVAALLVGAVTLAVVTAVARRPVPPPAVASGPVTSIVVDVRIEPASLPPASLVIVASPPGSRLSAGTALGSVPRRVVFDAEGTWQIEARFQDRRSETVTFRLPDERSVVLRFPSTP